ncbi:MAG TPA: glycosyltransferase family 4 protein [Candidatus Acidoferrum sp.]|jgi:D-inositol-3-phosphate glycosyltransferase|nr:glycosyltransferase family 4 protein [Candidatus Acidoferrum sp.]
MTAIQEKPIRSDSRGEKHQRAVASSSILKVALLTGGGDKHYVLGRVEALTSSGLSVDLIGSNDLLCPELLNNPQVNFLNLRGDQCHAASFVKKALRVSVYYVRLVRYAAIAHPKIFHILWNNKFELFDRTLLMAYYKCLGKKIVFTAHNVNARARDGGDSFLNRKTLKFQYRLCDHIFVHTEKMKNELVADFDVPDYKVSAVPYGINNAVPNTTLTASEAKRKLGLSDREQIMLFFGNIAPYKGLECLLTAFIELSKQSRGYRLIIAGRPKGCDSYWSRIQQMISGIGDRIIQRIEYVPDEQTELYFKAADVLVLPYTHIFQSGVLFIGYSFGLPVIVADVGSLKEEIVEGKTGFVFPAKDPVALAKVIESYFSSDLYKNLESRRKEIQGYANEHHSWAKVAAITTGIYSDILT